MRRPGLVNPKMSVSVARWFEGLLYMRKLLNERSGKRRSVFKDEPRPAETNLRDRRRGLMAVGPIRDLRLLTWSLSSVSSRYPQKRNSPGTQGPRSRDERTWGQQSAWPTREQR